MKTKMINFKIYHPDVINNDMKCALLWGVGLGIVLGAGITLGIMFLTALT